MSRTRLEKFQILFYLAALGAGLAVAGGPAAAPDLLEALLWPVLGCVLFATFAQVRLERLGDALKNGRFLSAAIVGNFLVIPLIVLGLVQFLPENPGIQLGVLLVLLVPCTDWFITFTHLARGDTRHAIAFTPISLLLQLVLLPFYLWLYLGETFAVTFAHREILAAFGFLILLPLVGAFLARAWAEGKAHRAVFLDRLAWLPVPLLAVVIFIVAATQAGLVIAAPGNLAYLLAAFAAFLAIAAPIAIALARVFGLPPRLGRVLVFSFGSRNSFVVLPIALALPAAYELAVVVIVFQSMVELAGMALYLWWVPRLFASPGRPERA